MTVISNLPLARPNVLLDFCNSGRVDPRVTATRGSAATRWNAIGQLERVPAGMPYINHDPATGRCLGLRVERTSTNLIRNSEKLDQSSWTKLSVTVVPNSATAPDGSNTAAKVIPTAASVQHGIATSFLGLTPFGSVTSVVYAKAAEKRFLQIRWFGGEGGISSRYANFDLVGVAAAGNADKKTIEHVGGGWCRCTAVINSIDSLTVGQDVGFEFIDALTDSRRPITLGDGVSGLYLWGARTCVGDYSPSYISTTDSQVTRAADFVSLALPKYRDITIALEYMLGGVTPNSVAARLYASNAETQYVDIMAASATTGRSAGLAVSSGFSAVDLALAPAADRVDRVAFSRSADGSMLVSSRGQTLAAGIHAGVVEQLNTLSLGGTGPTGSRQLNGHIRRASVWYSALTQAELNKLTEV